MKFVQDVLDLRYKYHQIIESSFLEPLLPGSVPVASSTQSASVTTTSTTSIANTLGGNRATQADRQFSRILKEVFRGVLNWLINRVISVHAYLSFFLRRHSNHLSIEIHGPQIFFRPILMKCCERVSRGYRKQKSTKNWIMYVGVGLKGYRKQKVRGVGLKGVSEAESTWSGS